MKRIVILILSVMLVLSSCAAEKTQSSDAPVVSDTKATEITEPTLPPLELTGDEDSFYLSYLPDIGEYEPDEAPERWYADYVGELIPSEEYGELIPYLGYEKEFDDFSYGEWGVREQHYYGLCTLGGVIVTDPVYSAIYMGGDGYYILQGQPEAVENERYTDYLYPFYIAKSDGSEVVSLPSPAAVCGYFAEDIYFTRTSYVDESGWRMYSPKGELLLEYRQDDIYWNIPTVHGNGTITVKSEDTEYFVNSRFECTSAIFKSISYIGDDLYIVKELSGKQGIIDIDGRYVAAAEYDMLEKTEFGYVSLKGDLVEAKDRDMNTLYSFTVDYEVKDISAIGPSVIYVRGEEKAWDNHYYSLEGKAYEYEDASLLHSGRKYYCFESDERTLITDIELNEVITFERGGVRDSHFSGVAEGYIVLRDVSVEMPNLMLYDVNEGDLIVGISDVYRDYYTVVADDGTTAYYDYDGNAIPPREKTESYVDYDREVETPYGKISMYIDGGYAYTEDSEGNIIVKRRAVFD